MPNLRFILAMDRPLASPGKNWPAQNFLNNNIRYQAGMPAVAIRKTMDRYDPVFEPNRNFIFRKSLIGYPIPTIIKQSS